MSNQDRRLRSPSSRPGCGCLGLPAAILVVMLIPFSLIVFNIGRTIFNGPQVKKVVADEVVSSDLIPVALQWLSDRRAQQRVDTGEALTGVTEPDIVLLMSFMDRADWRQVKAEVLPDQILVDWVSVTVDGVYRWIDSSDRVPQITLEMRPFKDRVNSEHGVNSIVIAYGNLEPCVQEQIDDFLARLAAVPPGTEVLYNLCQFPDPWHEDQFNDYVNSLHNVVKNIPDQFELTRELSAIPDDPGSAGPATIKAEVRLIRLLMLLAWLPPLLVLLAVLAFRIRSLQDLGRWWGLPLLVGGFLTLLPALAYRWLITSLVAAAPLSESPKLVLQEATRTILQLADYAFMGMLVQAIIITAMGLGLFVAARILRPKQAKY